MTDSPSPVSSTRVPFGVAVLGGPTVVIDLGGLRFVSDPTFDPPGDHGALRKTTGPAVAPEDLGPVDVVLVSHDDHADNLDDSGRVFARRAPVLLTSPSAAHRLGGNAVGLAPWTEHPPGNGLRVTAVPAQHGPTDGERTPEGFVNTDVTGFVVQADDGTTVYVSGDNASLRLVNEVHDRFPRIDVAVLHAGAAAVPAKFGGRPLSLTSERAAAAAEVLDARHVVVAHDEGWTHFHEGPDSVRSAFEQAGIQGRLVDAPLGSWWTERGR